MRRMTTHVPAPDAGPQKNQRLKAGTFAIPCQARERDSSNISILKHPFAAVALFTIDDLLFGI